MQKYKLLDIKTNNYNKSTFIAVLCKETSFFDLCLICTIFVKKISYLTYMDVFSCNTIVVGSGVAGLNAADRLYEFGQHDIAIVT